MDFMMIAALKSWRELNKMCKLSLFNEEQLWAMLRHEELNGGRIVMLVRIHQVASGLRTAREREELIAKIGTHGNQNGA